MSTGRGRRGGGRGRGKGRAARRNPAETESDEITSPETEPGKDATLCSEKSPPSLSAGGATESQSNPPQRKTRATRSSATTVTPLLQAQSPPSPSPGDTSSAPKVGKAPQGNTTTQRGGRGRKGAKTTRGSKRQPNTETEPDASSSKAETLGEESPDVSLPAEDVSLPAKESANDTDMDRIGEDVAHEQDDAAAGATSRKRGHGGRGRGGSGKRGRATARKPRGSEKSEG